MLKYASPAALLAALFLIGCSNKSGEAPSTGLLAHNDFENLDGWLANSPAVATLSRGKAHSGAYSTMVGPGHEYSLGYDNALSRLSPDWPAKLKVGAWVFLPNDQTKAKLVTELKAPADNGPGLLWDGLELATNVKQYNQWQYVEKTFTLPANAKASHRLLVYVWLADGKEPVYLDDLTISLARD